MRRIFGIGLLAILILAAACTAPPPSDSLVVAIPTDPDGFHPHQSVAAASSEIAFNIYEGLVKAAPDRTQRLLAAGVPLEVIEAQGQGLCKACLDLLKEVAPDEARNYRKLSLLDRLQGNNCPCKKKS